MPPSLDSFFAGVPCCHSFTAQMFIIFPDRGDLKLLRKLFVCVYIYIDGHESKPAISILAIVQESRKTSAFRYFSSYSFYFIT